MKLPELSDSRLDWTANTSPGIDLNQDELFEGVAWRRMAAFLIDFSIILVIVIALWALVFLSFGLLSILLTLAPLIPLTYHTLMIASPRSATLGMQFMSIEVRAQSGGRPGLLQAFAMTALFYFSIALATPLILIVALFNDRRHCLHDYLSGTAVVKTDVNPQDLRKGSVELRR